MLLAGWLAFWLLGLVQPFCDARAGESRDARSAAAQASGWSAGADHVRDHPTELCCTAISDAAIDAVKSLEVALFAQGDGDSSVWVSDHSRVPLFARRAAFVRASATPPPLDPSPLYLRTLRLRI